MSLQFKNFYTHPAVKQLGPPPFHYDAEKFTHISIPTRMAILGASGTRKTNWLINFIQHVKCFRTVYLVARHLNEPLYAFLRKHHKELGIKHVICCQNLEEYDALFPEIVKHTQPNVQRLAIMDDMLTEQEHVPDSVAETFSQGRKWFISGVWITSNWSAIDPKVRASIDILVLKRINDESTVQRLLRNAGLSKDALPVYKQITASPDDALVLDDSQGVDPRYKVRKNYTPIPLEQFVPGAVGMLPPTEHALVEPPPFVGGSVVRREQPTKHKKK